MMTAHRYMNEFSLEPADNKRLAGLCGQLHANIRLIENYLGVEINHRGHKFQIIGSRKNTRKASDVLKKLYQDSQEKAEIAPDYVHLILQSMHNQADEVIQEAEKLTIKTPKVEIHPRGKNQSHYLKSMLEHDLNFGIGPSGTGKTYLAVCCAVAALAQEKVSRIILVRPAVEAGEKLGFLPGDLTEKVNPYLRPLYDALYEMLGIERVTKLIETGVIELAPLAYMRGRTLNDAFIILDESQNTTKEQMKMFLTRIGFGSKAVVTGDITQVDLPPSTESGLRHAASVLADVDGVHFTFFQTKDVVRHPLVQHIVEAYERADKNV